MSLNLIVQIFVNIILPEIERGHGSIKLTASQYLCSRLVSVPDPAEDCPETGPIVQVVFRWKIPRRLPQLLYQ